MPLRAVAAAAEPDGCRMTTWCRKCLENGFAIGAVDRR